MTPAKPRPHRHDLVERGPVEHLRTLELDRDEGDQRPLPDLINQIARPGHGA
jgi:hypothetical protein